MKKVILVICIVSLTIAFYFFGSYISKNIQAIFSGKPLVIKHFACSDYCPGPEEKYVVWIYKGVDSKEECEKIDGEFSSYTGWGTFYICKVK